VLYKRDRRISQFAEDAFYVGGGACEDSKSLELDRGHKKWRERSAWKKKVIEDTEAVIMTELGTTALGQKEKTIGRKSAFPSTHRRGGDNMT